MQTTRQRIIEYLNNHHSASAIEMSRAFRMTSANLRHHLTILEEQGIIFVSTKQKKQGRGRPSYLYMLSKKSNQDNLANLSNALLRQVLGRQDGNARSKRLNKVADDLVGKKSTNSTHLTQWLGDAVFHFNQQNYDAHWEAHAEGAQIIFNRCPYAEIIEEHPQLCQLDEILVNKFVGNNVEQISKILHHPAGPHNCVFRLLES